MIYAEYNATLWLCLITDLKNIQQMYLVCLSHFSLQFLISCLLWYTFVSDTYFNSMDQNTNGVCGRSVGKKNSPTQTLSGSKNKQKIKITLSRMHCHVLNTFSRQQPSSLFPAFIHLLVALHLCTVVNSLGLKIWNQDWGESQLYHVDCFLNSW